MPSTAPFVMTFVAPTNPHDDPRYDLDTSSFALVKTFAGGRSGTTYADLPWEPNRAFRAIADYYGRRGLGPGKHEERSGVWPIKGR